MSNAVTTPCATFDARFKQPKPDLVSSVIHSPSENYRVFTPRVTIDTQVFPLFEERYVLLRLTAVRVTCELGKFVKEGKFPMGHLGLYVSADNVLDLDEQIDCLAFTYRPRACIITGDTPISFYNIESKEFTDIKDQAMKDKRRGYLVGLEYLLYFPFVERFGLFLMGNPTLRRESANLKALVDSATEENSITPNHSVWQIVFFCLSKLGRAYHRRTNPWRN